VFVRKVPACLAVFLLALTCLRASTLEADPHELYEAARSQLRNGDLQSAEVLLTRLRNMVSRGSQWDPDGVFANELLPPLLGRLRRMKSVSRQLDEFSDRALKDLQPPEISGDDSAVHRYTDWAASVVQRLRSERDQIISAGLSNPEEQAALTRTASYARTEQLLETDVLKSIADASAGSIADPPAEDPNGDPVQVRFRQLKQDLLRIMIERDQLQQRVKASRSDDRVYLGALVALVTEGVPQAPQRNIRPADVSEVFGQHLDREMERMRLLSAQTSLERDARLSALDRYRRYNGILTRARLGADQSRRIQALALVVENCPVEDQMLGTSSATKWSYGLLTGALALIAGFSLWLAVARGRRLSSERMPAQPVDSVLETRLPERKVHGNAA